MKRLVPLVLCGLLAAPAAQAQFGVKAGVNAAVLDGQNLSTSTKFRTTHHVGVFYEAKLFGPLSVQPELQYSLQGGSFKSEAADFATKLHYLNAPVLAKVRLARAYVEAGPQLGLLLKAREEGRLMVGETNDGTAVYGSDDRGAWNRYKKADLSLCVGAGVKLLAGLSVGARFVAGLSDVNEARHISGVNDERLRNRVFQGFVAYQLP
ncbi:PorT family protein [Hymenobacter sp. 15J16-1T3B]|uniref:porin family protein n=1 Tax=Hymenobacter sp. 15J16-1T3B TaxID=2886941 RepID=UPI001D113AEB|nr:porin family protein [Hymenobacter sp. 15J16-1T3B]MCC3155884.1 PorT family protein [Hymenobacter sp. 15J16-1T3B]